MKLQTAIISDLESIIAFYDDVIDCTLLINQHARWSKGKHPTAQGIWHYIEEGCMYLYVDGDRIKGAMAVTMRQGEEYHPVEWSVKAEDDEVAVIHILGVHPDFQGMGIASGMVQEAIGLARSKGRKAVRLDTLASNTPAQNLYKRLGFKYCGCLNMYAENTAWVDFCFFEFKLFDQ